MQFLALEHDAPGCSQDDFAPHLQAEAAAVWRLYQSGVIRNAYFRQDRRAAVLLLECSDADAAQEFLQTLPLVRHRLITFEIIPLGPYTGFERLFHDPDHSRP